VVRGIEFKVLGQEEGEVVQREEGKEEAVGWEMG
jgi:hypothetical protein